MNSMNLKDFRPDIPDFDSEEENLENAGSQLSASIYREEINTLKIDKLSNRVTIISIIIPCLIGALLVFAYLDMKERVIDVDQTKQSQVDRISHQLEEKLNALDVKIAKNRFDLDNNLPELGKKNISLEGQIAKFASSKADSKTIEAEFAKLEKRIANNANQDKTTLQTIERINKETLSTFKKNQNRFDKTAKEIKKEVVLFKKEFDKTVQEIKKTTTFFKKEFDARLLDLPDYEQQTGELRKDFSLLDKKYRNLEQESVSQVTIDEKITQLKTDFNYHMNNLDNQVDTLNQKLIANILRLQKNIDQLSVTSPKSTKPKPQINIDSSGSVNIEAKPLTQ